MAIDGVSATVEARARLFRNLIVFVTLASLGATVVAAASGSPRPLAALAALLPACGAFVYLDARLVDRWRSGVTNAWAGGEVTLEVLREAVEAIPTLPPETARGMLDTLPPLRADGEPCPVMRGAIARTADVIASARRRLVVWRTLWRTTVACGVLLVLLAGPWGWVPAALAVAADRLARPLVTRTLSRRAVRIVDDVRGDIDGSVERVVHLLDGLDWRPASSREKAHLLAELRTPSVARSSSSPGR